MVNNAVVVRERTTIFIPLSSPMGLCKFMSNFRGKEGAEKAVFCAFLVNNYRIIPNNFKYGLGGRKLKKLL